MNDCVETANGGCESCVNDLVLSPVGMMTLEEENTFGSIIFYQYIYILLLPPIWSICRFFILTFILTTLTEAKDQNRSRIIRKQNRKDKKKYY